MEETNGITAPTPSEAVTSTSALPGITDLRAENPVGPSDSGLNFGAASEPEGTGLNPPPSSLLDTAGSGFDASSKLTETAPYTTGKGGNASEDADSLSTPDKSGATGKYDFLLGTNEHSSAPFTDEQWDNFKNTAKLRREAYERKAAALGQVEDMPRETVEEIANLTIEARKREENKDEPSSSELRESK
jgi:hypothetical protein